MIFIASLILLLQDDADVEFQGAQSVSRSDLLERIKPDLKRYRAEPRMTVLEDAVFRILHEYQIQGYAFAEVHVEKQGDKIVFVVTEGPRVLLGRIRFRGNVALSGDELRALLPDLPTLGAAPYSRRLVAMLSDAVASAYARIGFLDATIAPPRQSYDSDQGTMDVILHINEGKRYFLEDYLHLPVDPEPRASLEELKGKPYTSDTAGQIESMLVDYYRENGRPFARALAHPKIDRESSQVTVELDVELGPSARIGSVRVQGAVKTREGFILQRADIPKGVPFRLSDLRQAEHRLRQTNLFYQVSVSPGPFQEETGDLTIEVRVEEREAGEFSFRAGYGSLDGYRLGSDVSYANLFGGGEVLQAGGTWAETGWRADVGAAVPFIAGTDLRAAVNFFYESKVLPSFDVTSYGVVPSVSYPLLESLRLTVGCRFTSVDTDNVEGNVPPGDLLNFGYPALFLNVGLDRRDNPLFPTSGFFLDGGVEWSGRTIGSEVSFFKAFGRVSFYAGLPWGIVLATSFQGGVIVPQEETEEIPIALRFFAGGVGTVRGFEFGDLGPQVGGEPTGGEVFLSAQCELRIPIWGDLHGAIFADRGGVWFHRGEVDLRESRYGVGAGLRYYTPAGAIVLDFAINPERESGEEWYAIHLSIGFPF